MKDINYTIAKNIFLKYSGSHFFMEREGDYEYYKSFNISKEQELLWIKEYQQEILVLIEVEHNTDSSFSTLASIIRQYKDISCFISMLEIAKRKVNKLDSFTKMRFAEIILSVVESFDNLDIKENAVISNAKDLGLEILKDVINNPITVAEHYKELDYLKDTIEEKNIIKRAKNTITNWERLRR